MLAGKLVTIILHVGEDPRPCPSIEEVYETIEKIRQFEDSINTVYLPEQLEQMGIKQQEIERAIT